MQYFVRKDSIVREIWGKGDTILFIFAGSAAEFALNKAVDWLYFTGRLPADPIGRLFSTVSYARQIIFSEREKAHQAIDKITAIHGAVESNRGSKIPDWAYRDVLFMLIDYSIRAFELLERKMTDAEKEDTFAVFHEFGERMAIPDLPTSYPAWQLMREAHLSQDLIRSKLTIDLFKQYQKHLGWWRYKILLQSQALVVPPLVKEMLALQKNPLLLPMVPMYKLSRLLGFDRAVKEAILPDEYKDQILNLDILP